jgi:hypothetical protein
MRVTTLDRCLLMLCLVCALTAAGVQSASAACDQKCREIKSAMSDLSGTCLYYDLKTCLWCGIDGSCSDMNGPGINECEEDGKTDMTVYEDCHPTCPPGSGFWMEANSGKAKEDPVTTKRYTCKGKKIGPP